jgi:DNA-binding CsgD family transcriptional regulator
MMEYQFDTPEQITSALIERAGLLLALRWQACFVRQLEGAAWEDSRCRLVAAAGEVPLRVLQLRPIGVENVQDLDATIIPIEHAGRVSALWLLGPQRHGAHLGPAQVAEMAGLARPASAPLEVAMLRAWATLPRRQDGVEGASNDRALTTRQLEVARLVGLGLTNVQIAAALAISRGTAAKHIEHIMDRLNAQSRSQIAVWAAQNLGHTQKSQ